MQIRTTSFIWVKTLPDLNAGQFIMCQQNRSQQFIPIINATKNKNIVMIYKDNDVLDKRVGILRGFVSWPIVDIGNIALIQGQYYCAKVYEFKTFPEIMFITSPDEKQIEIFTIGNGNNFINWLQTQSSNDKITTRPSVLMK